MCRGNNDYKYYAHTHPVSEAAAASSNLEPLISFALGLRYEVSILRLRVYGSGPKGGGEFRLKER